MLKLSALSGAFLALLGVRLLQPAAELLFAAHMAQHLLLMMIAGQLADRIDKARLARFVRLFGKPDRLPVVIREHVAILDALDAGHLDRAIEELEYHLDMAFTILKQLPEEYGPYVVD